MKNQTHKQNNIQEGNPKSKAIYHHGSTTQGGSTFGQGSLQLGKQSQRQGSENNEGANYGNERGWNNEALRRKDENVIPKRHK
ncbi:MAG TPA: hypothetical protein VHD83_22155 [Puia sp.]|nr:hypothetical protein [Puia sp.]